jgi:heat shock protein HtpX
MFTRVALIFVTNILILIMLSIVLSLLGVQPYLTEAGINYQSLAIFSLAYGFGAALISLAMSRMIAKWAMKVQVIDPSNPGQYSWLLNKTHELCKRAGLDTMPEVGVYNSAEVNAFATGPTKKKSLVAVSSGLLSRMKENEIEGVLAHEVAHIKNGDMVTMTLIQGLVNAFIIFLVNVIVFFVRQRVNRDMGLMVEIGLRIALHIAIGMLGMIVVNWFSRHREFRADKGATEISPKENMIAALKCLGQQSGRMEADTGSSTVSTLKISGGRPTGFRALIASHPPIEDRIKALEGRI